MSEQRLKRLIYICVLGLIAQLIFLSINIHITPFGMAFGIITYFLITMDAPLPWDKDEDDNS